MKLMRVIFKIKDNQPMTRLLGIKRRHTISGYTVYNYILATESFDRKGKIHRTDNLSSDDDIVITHCICDIFGTRQVELLKVEVLV